MRRIFPPLRCCRLQWPLRSTRWPVGVSFAAMQVSIGPAVALIGVTTCCLSAVGVKVGNLFGMRYKAMAERAGGIVLILMGAKILLEGIGIL